MPFAPSDISGLKIWLKADAGLSGLSDNDPVSTWADQSGTSHDFTGSSTTRPLYKTGIQNGLPGVKFDGSDDYLDGGNLDSVFPSAASVFIVYKVLSSDNQWVLIRNTSNDSWWDFSGAGYLGSFRLTRVETYPSSVPNTGTHSYFLKSSSSTYRAAIDGVLATAQSASFDEGSGMFYLGGLGPGDGSRNFTGYIFEVIVYDSAISDADLANLESYAEAKWGFPGTPTAVAQVTETDTANTFTRLKRATAAQVTETDLANAFTRVKIKSIGQALETDLAQIIADHAAVALAQALETDTANVFGRVKAKALAQALETDTANVFTHARRAGVGQALETDVAAVIGHPRVLVLGQAMET